MSLTGAFNAARSGLSTTQTLSRVSADNVSNAMTPGYVRRTAALTTPGGGQGGVLVGEIRREVNESLVRMSRLEGAKMARHQVVQEGLASYTVYFGQPGDGTSPAEKFSTFSSSLTTLANMPSSQGAQSASVLAAQDLAASVRGASGMLANTRSEVDMEIRYEVSDLNQALHQIAHLNTQRRNFHSGTLEAAEFGDQIDSVIDQIAEIVDIRTARTADGGISIYTTSGAALVEGDQVQDISFNPGDGTLFAGSQEITFGKTGVRGIAHGTLAGLSELKNDILPRFQSQLDEYARALIETFEAADDSVGPGVAGLFTDNGLPFDAANISGLANRLRVNDLVTVGSTETWRMRDGLGAATPGDAASSVQILKFIDSMDNTANADPNSGISAQVTLRDFATELVAAQSSERAQAENRFSASKSSAEVIESARQNGEGVNIDDEMQKLMLIEKSYAANSQILKTLSEMIDTLLAAV